MKRGVAVSESSRGLTSKDLMKLKSLKNCFKRGFRILQHEMVLYFKHLVAHPRRPRGHWR